MGRPHRHGSWQARSVLALVMSAGLVLGSSTAAQADGAFGSQPVEVSHSPALPPTAIVSVQTGIHPGYDRVVITTAGPLSRYAVRFASSVVNSPKGDPAAVPGSAYLTISVSSVEWQRALPFPARIDVNGPELIAVVRTEQFEGTVGLALGLRGRTAFRVFTLTGPDRLVVDVAAPAASPTAPTLPATGAPVLPLVLLGLALVAMGTAVHRLARGPA